MYLQRPSTGRSQDVRHILARTFRDLYTRDAVRPDVVKNLQVSKGGDDPYHERYVDNLQKVGFFNVLTRVKIARMVCLNDVFCCCYYPRSILNLQRYLVIFLLCQILFLFRSTLSGSVVWMRQPCLRDTSCKPRLGPCRLMSENSTRLPNPAITTQILVCHQVRETLG